ncbi:disintegrin and metalloproteinase domain-containing protein 19 [Gadus chalcogrammus]|uniref:disintegrin and metalloproteinase domain-containing protein 19 n=1 Tax=Gadus chalcogrammus TaxID=1042646 RepID=UPI0024C4B944|nr:disintegrin and metalloproteinase domain-containing protein 19 [Gadus chalcogrammus]
MSPEVRPVRFDVCLDCVLSTLCLIVVLQCGVVSAASGRDAYSERGKQSLLGSHLDQVESYEVTYPRWLNPVRNRRSSRQQFPSKAEVFITAEGQELRLQLEKNEQLLSPGYQEIWYTPSGSRRTSTPGHTGHCFYHGEVQGMEGSSVAVSTCSGLRGLISLNTSVSYVVEPLPVATDTPSPPPHAVYRAESLRLRNGSCPHHHGNEEHEDSLDRFIHGMMTEHTARVRRDISQNMKYVELLLVADHAEFEKHGLDLDRTRRKLLEAANLVDKYYRALNIRVALIGLEVWSNRDQIAVSDNPYSTLAAFLAWRRKQLRALPNDNAQLITGISFQGTTIGLAPLKAMCSDYQSGGVNADHAKSAVGVAATMAHEMGHNFGMSHDGAGCCQARPEDGGCIMAAATGDPFPRVFNGCNQRELSRYLGSGGGKCLFNLPNTRAMYGGQRCGNGYLEDGEECDCGGEEECTSPCCNANNCTLKAGAECAHGVCCDDCKLKSPGVECRAPSGSCDLPEYCDGKAESCPANFYLVDGVGCGGGRGYCYTGMCLSLEQQCRSLWGADGHPAPDVCFERVNKAGDSFGNCGKDLLGKYRGCKERDAKCGKIQCASSAMKPIETNAVSIDTTVVQGNGVILCRGTHVYQPGQEGAGQGDTLDPGLVMTGTKCGADSLCFEGQCRNASFLRAGECSAKCHGHGLCNNYHNCHCDSGWAPPLCDRVGAGGSVDSGPVISRGGLLPLLLILPLVLFLALAAVTLGCCYRHKLRPLKSPATARMPQGPRPAEAKTPPTTGPAHGHSNPTFSLKRQESLQQSTPRPGPPCASRSRYSIVRPTGKPPPVPAYATKPALGPPPVPAQGPQTSGPAPPQSRPTPPPPPPPAPPSVHAGRPRKGHTPPPAPPPPPHLGVQGSDPGPPSPRPEAPNRPPPPCPVRRTVPLLYVRFTG